MRIDSDPSLFLGECEVIDYRSTPVALLATRLADIDQHATARNCFRYVRDEIEHSGDHRLNPVTCSASEVLQHGTGYCYAKNHLLCALLRANEVPAGLCYQRLSIDGVGAPYCLHGLNGVFLPAVGWYRIDARGNREGIEARFTPPAERLAFSTDLADESDLPDIYVEPLPVVVDALRESVTWDALNELPDL